MSSFPPDHIPPSTTGDDPGHDQFPLSEQGAVDDDDYASPAMDTKHSKSIGFYLSFVGLLLSMFIYSLDATTLAVAIPVFIPCPFLIFQSLGIFDIISRSR